VPTELYENIKDRLLVSRKEDDNNNCQNRINKSIYGSGSPHHSEIEDEENEAGLETQF
jgi:hypothetical protein